MLIEQDKIYRHADGGLYRVLDAWVSLKCPESRRWYIAVLYESKKPDGKTFVRTQKDFVRRFALAVEATP